MYKLYWSAQTAALAPEIVLELAAIPYEKINVNLPGGEHKGPEFLDLNPAGSVPVLVATSGEVLTETTAILTILCEQHSLDLMPPIGHSDRGQFLRYLGFLTNTIQPTYRRWYHVYTFIDDEKLWSRIKEIGMEEQVQNWSVIEDQLKLNTSPYMFGNALSITDIMVAMLVTWHPNYQTLLNKYPSLKKCFEAVLSNAQIHQIMKRGGDI